MKEININGVAVPSIFYGTAWKEERTEGLVIDALSAGFRAIDTANQRRHYNEAAVGAALDRADVPRDQLFLQTKFTYAEGQDYRLPYDPFADHRTQVRQSFASSLEHLGVETIDSLLLHGPRSRRGLAEVDIDVWREMESLQKEGRTRLIGVSNMTAEQLTALIAIAAVKPSFIQNRCFARLGWDREVRDVCAINGIVYQGFSLLTANQQEIESTQIRMIAAKYGKTRPQVVFRFALQLGMIALTGTTDREHMASDLDVFDFELTSSEMELIEQISR